MKRVLLTGIAALLLASCGCESTTENQQLPQDIVVPNPESIPDSERPLLVHKFAVGDEVVITMIDGEEFNGIVDTLSPDGSYVVVFDVTREVDDTTWTMTFRMTEVPESALRNVPQDIIPQKKG